MVTTKKRIEIESRNALTQSHFREGFKKIMRIDIPVETTPTRTQSNATRVDSSEFLLDWFNQFSVSIGVPCACFEQDSLRMIASSYEDHLPFTLIKPPEVTSGIQKLEIRRIAENLIYFMVPLPVDHRFFVSGFARTTPSAKASDVERGAMAADWTEERFNDWLNTVPVCDESVLKCLLKCALQSAEKHRHEIALQLEVNSQNQRIDYAHEQINLLHTLTSNLHLSRPTEELANLCLDKLQLLLDCSGFAVCLRQNEQAVSYLSKGELPFDDQELDLFLALFGQHDWSQPLVCNRLENSLIGPRFPGLKNLVVASFSDQPGRSGWIVACNLGGGRDFGAVESNVLGAISTILGTHEHNIQLFNRHDALQISFVRSLVSSLVSSLDAKDSYTRGHSERVALIARRLAEQLNLSKVEIDDIYLSSLLHDLGKIGVSDQILAKTDKLTVEEFAQIQQHPTIGYDILSHLTNLKSILPGVRNHHEAYNGTGYPDRLRGEQIPLMARVIAVADAYDAMASDRPYREGMPLEKLECIFRRGSGEQWDPIVIDAYFAVRDEVRELCESHSLTVGNLLDTLNVNNSGIFSVRSVQQAVSAS